MTKEKARFTLKHLVLVWLVLSLAACDETPPYDAIIVLMETDSSIDQNVHLRRLAYLKEITDYYDASQNLNLTVLPIIDESERSQTLFNGRNEQFEKQPFNGVRFRQQYDQLTARVVNRDIAGTIQLLDKHLEGKDYQRLLLIYLSDSRSDVTIKFP